MSRITEYKSARKALDHATGDLTDKARQYAEANQGWRLRELLAAAREYGRAFNRVERMRSGK